MPRGGRSIKRRGGGTTLKTQAEVSGRRGQRQHKKKCQCNQCCPPPPNVTGAKLLGESEILDNSKTIRCFTDYMYMLNNRHMRRTQGKRDDMKKSVENMLVEFNSHVSIVSKIDTDKTEATYLASQFIQKAMYSTNVGKIEVDGTLGNFSNGFLGSQWVDILSLQGKGPEIRRWAFYTKWNVPDDMTGIHVRNQRDTTFYFVDCGIINPVNELHRKADPTVSEVCLSEMEEILGAFARDIPSNPSL